MPAHLPSELLLHIIEHVPVDYVLDWRLVCRTFRDAIDKQVLYHYLRRTRLLGCLGSTRMPGTLTFNNFLEPIHMLEARFSHLEDVSGGECDGEKTGDYAVFRIDDEWYRAFDNVVAAQKLLGDAFTFVWRPRLEELELFPHADQSEYGELRWCIALDHAVLDLDFPVERSRMHFDIAISINARRIRVGWKDMLIRFLKTERALRVLLDEKRTCRNFTFSHTSDCLSAVRRARLSASLNLTDPSDLDKWHTLRLLPPLFGVPDLNPPGHSSFSPTENSAIYHLVVLRRSAFLSPDQLSHLHGVASDFRRLELLLCCMEDAGDELNISLSFDSLKLPDNPVAWSDEARNKIEGLVRRWREQGRPVDSLKALVVDVEQDEVDGVKEGRRGTGVVGDDDDRESEGTN